jgi:DNA-binding PadR family transcriptional regulator
MVKNLRERIVKTFLDVFILSQLTKTPKGGYRLIALIHNKFDILVSSGTVYTKLYSLERDGFIDGEYDERKRVYTLTKKGLESLESIRKANGEINHLLRNVLSLNGI